MRTARVEEAEEHADALVRIATELGWKSAPTSKWAVCVCSDGKHAVTSGLLRHEAWDEDDARRWAVHYHGHAIVTVTIALVGPTREVAA